MQNACRCYGDLLDNVRCCPSTSAAQRRAFPARPHRFRATPASTIRHILRTTALAEIGIYRDVTKAVMAHLGRILRWSKPKSATLAAGIQGAYAYERLGGWRRMVSLNASARRSALGGPSPDAYPST
jgi:hypothetical protein